MPNRPEGPAGDCHEQGKPDRCRPIREHGEGGARVHDISQGEAGHDLDALVQGEPGLHQPLGQKISSQYQGPCSHQLPGVPIHGPFSCFWMTLMTQFTASSNWFPTQGRPPRWLTACFKPHTSPPSMIKPPNAKPNPRHAPAQKLIH